MEINMKNTLGKDCHVTLLFSLVWTEQVTISLKGEQKKQEHFQVRLGPDGKPQKTSLDPPAEAAAPSGGRLKQHVVAKKKEEYKDYVSMAGAASVSDGIWMYQLTDKGLATEITAKSTTYYKDNDLN
jgi:hypothetical protein